MEDEGPTTHITVWVAAPFYVAESLDLAVHFPLTADRLEDIVRWALPILPETMEELVPTTPQLHDDFASYILCPSWLADVDKYCIVLDCIDIGGPAFAIYHEGPLTKRNILDQVPADDVSNLEAFLFGELNPLCEGDRRQPVMGGVIKILRRGAVCDWAVTELAPRFVDTTAWRPATDLPHPASGYHVVYQGVDDQVICEGYVPDPGGHEQRGARELELEGPCWALIPGEPPENLSHGGKIVLAPIAILQESEFDREEVTIIFLDLRQISFFPQWMALRGDPVLDPAAYLEGIQFPTVANWEVVVVGGDPIEGSNNLRVRDGEVVVFYLQSIEAQEDDDASMASNGTDHETDSESDSDDSGPSLDSGSFSGHDNLPPADGRPRGPPPPEPTDRSRSPRRNGPHEPSDGCHKVALADHLPPRTFDMTTSSLPLPHTLDQLWALLRPWPSDWMRYSFDGVNVSKELCAAITAATDWPQLSPPGDSHQWDFHLYTDGSAQRDNSRSGYSVVVMLRVGATLMLMGLIGEQLVGNAVSQWPVTHALALDAEQVALSVAILWAIQLRAVLPTVWCTVHYDCMSAGKAAAGIWEPADGMGERLRNLCLMAENLDGLHLQYEHVKGHAGNAWNEVADAVAKDCARGGSCCSPPPEDTVSTFLRMDLAWVGYGLQAAIHGSAKVENGALTWTENGFRPFALTEGQLIPTVEPEVGAGVKAPGTFRIKACTINVQGLTGHHKYVEEQLDHMGMNIVFLQETKGNEGQCQSKTYFRLETEACRHFGVAIWLHQKLGAWSVDGCPVTIREEDVEVLHGGARLLVIMIRKGQHKFAFISGHCPHAANPGDRNAFLKQLDEMMGRLKHVQFMLCGIDLNGRIPVEYGTVSGGLQCGDADTTGCMFAEVLSTAGAWVPATFADLHCGESFTYCHPSGIESRIDYLCVGGRTRIHGAYSEVRRDFDNGSPNEDHRLSSLVLEGALHEGQDRSRLWRPVYDRSKMATPEGRAIIEEACRSFPQPDWETHPDDHCQQIQDHLVSCLRQHFSLETNGARSSYIPEKVWNLRERKNAIKQRTRNRRQLWRKFRDMAFYKWRDQSGVALEDTILRHGMLYEIVAGAVGVVTQRIKRMIVDAKNKFLQSIATEGNQGVAAILQRARRAGIGGRAKRPVARPLPRLIDPISGKSATSAQDRDEIWLHFFGEQEQGEVITTKQFIQEAKEWSYQASDGWQWNLLPSTVEVERIFRRVPRGKAAGLDSIPSDLLANAPSDMARLVHPLYMKALLGGRQPIQWRGGILYESYKNAGPAHETGSHRSLYISSFLGKSLHKAVRAKVQKEVQTFLHPLHCGSKQQTPILFPSLFVTEHLRRCRRQGKSAAVLFVDCRAAYYRLIRELAVGDIRLDRTIEALFARFGLDGEDIAELQQLVQSGGMFREAEIPEQICSTVCDFHLHTWAITRFADGGKVCTSRAGSRPGASWADTLFAFIYAKILYRVHELLEGEGLNYQLPWDSTSGPFATQTDDEPQSAWDTTWADDSAWTVEGEDAEQLLCRVKRVSSIVVSLFRSHGLSPNLKRDKTSVILRLVGKGATTVRKRYFSSGKPELFLEDLQEAIPIVKQYRHLGAIIDPEMKLGAERRHRTALANAAYDSAKDLLLQNRALGMQTRSALFQSSVVSTYFNLPLWIVVGSEWEKMSNAFSRIVRRLLTKVVDGPTLFRAPLPLVHWATGCWPLEYFARRGRISALISLAKAAPPVLWAAIQSTDQWRQQLCQDLHWLVNGDVEAWPHVSSAGSPHWCHLLRMSPERIKRRARKRHQEDFVKYKVDEATSVCLWTLYRTVNEGGKTEEVRRYKCFMCDKDFKNRAGLGAHHYKSHGRWAAYRQCVVGSLCRACETEFWSVARLEDHLRASHSCSQQLIKQGLCTKVIQPGYGSRRRRQVEIEQFTPAAPQRAGSAPARLDEGHWSWWQQTFYQEVCQVLHVMGEEEEMPISAQLFQLIRKHPLFEEEIREALDRIEAEANALQGDPDVQPWSEQQFRIVREAVELARQFVSAATTQGTVTTEAMTRQSFRDTVKDYDWQSVVHCCPDDYVTRSSSLFILAEGWEAVWPAERGELLNIAVVKDPLLLLPSVLQKTWAAFLNKEKPWLRAPDTFWQHPLSAPFRAFREPPALS